MTIYALTCVNSNNGRYSPKNMSRFVQSFQGAAISAGIFVDVGVNRDYQRGFEEFQISSGEGIGDPAFLRAMRQATSELNARAFIAPAYLPGDGNQRTIWTPEPRETIRRAAILTVNPS